MNAITLENVTKRFGRETAVDQLDLAVPTGAIYGFIGPNGSGKTTTLRMILRIFQPDQGTVNVLGQDRGNSADDRLGYLPEERGLYKRMKVRNLLKYYARLKGSFQCKGEIDYWLERLGATEWQHKRIDMLSKGMAQKIQFISAVVAKPQLVILDEPFSGLDPVNLETLREAVLSLRKNGTTVIFSTHDMEVAQRMCDTIFMIFKGKKVLDGTLSEIQATYPANRVRVRLLDPAAPFPSIDGISSLIQHESGHEFIMDDVSDSQKILQQLSLQVGIEHFEIIRPTLHEIFVQIAKPHQDGASNEGGER